MGGTKKKKLIPENVSTRRNIKQATELIEKFWMNRLRIFLSERTHTVI